MPSKDSDQPAHSHSLIRLFTGHILDSKECDVSSYGQEETDQTARVILLHNNFLFYICIFTIIGIKHGFSCINIRQVPWEVLKTEAEGHGFQHLPRDLANVNALKNHVRSLLLHKKLKTFATFRVFSCTFVFRIVGTC